MKLLIEIDNRDIYKFSQFILALDNLGIDFIYFKTETILTVRVHEKDFDKANLFTSLLIN